MGPGRRGSAATSDDAAKERKKQYLQAMQLHWQIQEEFFDDEGDVDRVEHDAHLTLSRSGCVASVKEKSQEVFDDVDGSVDFDAPNEGNEVDQQGSFRVQKKEFGAIPPFPTLVADDGVLEGGEGQQPWQFPRLKKKKGGGDGMGARLASELAAGMADIKQIAPEVEADVEQKIEKAVQGSGRSRRKPSGW